MCQELDVLKIVLGGRLTSRPYKTIFYNYGQTSLRVPTTAIVDIAKQHIPHMDDAKHHVV